MEQSGYGQFCPVSMAAEIFCSRWTPLVLRELLCGSTRFNDLRRGVPRMSPSLLSKRLRELEQAGLIVTRKGSQSGVVEYHLTEAGKDLQPVVMALGFWGQRWVESQLSLKNLDPSLLMWDMRRWLNPQPLPPRRCTIHFQYPELASGSRDWWLVVEDGAVDLCLFDPGHEVDLHITGSLRSMTAIWMGLSTFDKEIAARQIEISGDRAVEARIHQWMGLSPFAKEKRRAA
jgi:DNA-binding HxlR family transcriptional regulator